MTQTFRMCSGLVLTLDPDSLITAVDSRAQAAPQRDDTYSHSYIYIQQVGLHFLKKKHNMNLSLLLQLTRMRSSGLGNVSRSWTWTTLAPWAWKSSCPYLSSSRTRWSRGSLRYSTLTAMGRWTSKVGDVLSWAVGTWRLVGPESHMVGL